MWPVGAILDGRPASASRSRGRRLGRGGNKLSAWRTWLRPGMLIKRWIALFILSMVLTSLALAMALANIYDGYEFPRATTGFVRALTLQFIPHPYRELLMFVVGGGLLAFSFWRLSTSILTPLMKKVGVPLTPLRAPLMKSSRTFAS